MDWLNTPLSSAMIAALVSAGLTWFIAGRHYLKQQRRALFARLMANRSMPLKPPFFEALNELPATFADDKRVKSAWRTMLKHGTGPNNENLFEVLRATARAAGATLDDVTDEELISPFVPGPGNMPTAKK